MPWAITGIGDALDGLHRLQIQLIIVIIANDEVGFVGATDQLDRNRIHIGLDVGCGDSRSAIGDARIRDLLPESPSSAIDAAIGAAGGSAEKQPQQGP